jgi:hypothetical protein
MEFGWPEKIPDSVCSLPHTVDIDRMSLIAIVEGDTSQMSTEHPRRTMNSTPFWLLLRLHRRTKSRNGKLRQTKIKRPLLETYLTSPLIRKSRMSGPPVPAAVALADAQVLGHFERRAAYPADDTRTIAAGQRVIHFTCTRGAVEQRRIMTVRWHGRRLSHKFPRL